MCGYLVFFTSDYFVRLNSTVMRTTSDCRALLLAVGTDRPRYPFESLSVRSGFDTGRDFNSDCSCLTSCRSYRSFQIS